MSNPLKSMWHLDPHLVFLNHGSFGACPKDLLLKQNEYRQQLETSPIHFMVHVLPELLAENKQALAELLHCQASDLFFITNATQGVQTALNHLPLQAGDELIYSNHIYGACRNQLLVLAEQKGLVLKEVQYPFVGIQAQEIVDAFISMISPKTKAILIDHITSPTALVQPIQPIIDFARKLGIYTIVDGAHAPGHIPLNLDALQADFYTGNCHKWLCTPKGCAFLWVNPRFELVLPTVISHGFGAPADIRMQAMFDWTGTQDFTPFLCLKDSIKWMNDRMAGGLSAVMAHNHQLAIQGRNLLMGVLGIPQPVGDDLLGAMASLPISDEREMEDVGFNMPLPLQRELFELGIEVPVVPWPRRPCRLVRISAQIYNEMGEYARLGEALRGLI